MTSWTRLKHPLCVMAAVAALAAAPTAAAAAAATRAAHGPAVSCTDSWASAVSGTWATASDWSTGSVPTSTTNACITVAGTYTVTLNGSGSASSVTIGSASGTPTLAITATASQAATLTLSGASSSISHNGVLVVDAPPKDMSAAIAGGASVTLSNDGVIDAQGALASEDVVDVGLQNQSDGTVDVTGANTLQETGTSTNNGSITVAKGASYTIFNATGTFDQAAGTLVVNGTLSATAGSTFVQAGGTDSGNAITIDTAALFDSGGAGNFVLVGTDSLRGTVPSTQSLTVVGTVGTQGTTTLTGNVTNSGTIALDSQQRGFPASLVGGSFTITNDGSFNVIGATYSPDYLRASVTNDPGGHMRVTAGSVLQDSGATITNDGKLAVSKATSLALSGAGTSLVDSGGTFQNHGTIDLQSGSSFIQSGGDESGNAIQLDGSSLQDSAGTGSFELFGSNSLRGTIAPGQNVSVIGTATSAATTRLSGTVVNDGVFVLDSQAGGKDATIVGGGTVKLTNDGTLVTQGATTGKDQLTVNLTNESGGTVSIDGPTVQARGTQVQNDGALDVADGASLVLGRGSHFSQSSTGTLGVTIDATTGAFGLTAVNVSLAGTLDVTTVGTPASGTRYVVVNATNTLGGTFATVSSGVDYTVSYGTTSVTLTAP